MIKETQKIYHNIYDIPKKIIDELKQTDVLISQNNNQIIKNDPNGFETGNTIIITIYKHIPEKNDDPNDYFYASDEETELAYKEECFFAKVIK